MENTNNKITLQTLIIPIAIIIAGAFIAFGIYMSGTSEKGVKPTAVKQNKAEWGYAILLECNFGLVRVLDLPHKGVYLLLRQQNRASQDGIILMKWTTIHGCIQNYKVYLSQSFLSLTP